MKDNKLTIPPASKGELCPCGGGEGAHFNIGGPTKQVLRCKTCHTDHFWRGHITARKAGDPCALVVKGAHYRYSPDQPPGQMFGVGSGGSLFRIRFTDGRRVETRNLWHQGPVPAKYLDELPDNAEFLPNCGDGHDRQLSGVLLHCQEEREHEGPHRMGLLTWADGKPVVDDKGRVFAP